MVIMTTNDVVSQLEAERDLLLQFMDLHNGNKSVERIYGSRVLLLNRAIKEAMYGYTKDVLWQKIRSGCEETTERVLKFLFIMAFAPKVQVDL
jgi:hypothetical protein